MNIVDIILLICFIPALIQGFRKGFISQIIGIASIIFCTWISFKSAAAVNGWISQYIHASEQMMKVISFILIFIAVAIGMFFLCKLIEGAVKLVMLEWLNKLLGVIFALLNAALIIGLAIMIFCSLNNSFDLVSSDILEESTIFPILKNMAYSIFPYLKELLFWNK